MKAIEPQHTAAAWWDGHYQANRAQEWSIWKDRALAAWVAQYSYLPGGARVYLPACGAAHCARSIAAYRPDLEWLLSDYSPAGLEAGLAACELGRVRLAETGHRVADIQSYDAWIDPAIEGCDAVILTEVLEHLSDPFRLKVNIPRFARLIATMPIAEKYVGPATACLFDPFDMDELFRRSDGGSAMFKRQFDGILVGIAAGVLCDPLGTTRFPRL